MKVLVRGLMWIGVFSASIAFAEYEMIRLISGGIILFIAACSLGAVAFALYRAPQGAERMDGFHAEGWHYPSPVPAVPLTSRLSATRFGLALRLIVYT